MKVAFWIAGILVVLWFLGVFQINTALISSNYGHGTNTVPNP